MKSENQKAWELASQAEKDAYQMAWKTFSHVEPGSFLDWKELSGTQPLLSVEVRGTGTVFQAVNLEDFYLAVTSPLKGMHTARTHSPCVQEMYREALALREGERKEFRIRGNSFGKGINPEGSLRGVVHVTKVKTD